MKKLQLLLIFFCLHTSLFAQTSFLSYIDVLTEFYTHYSFSKDLLPDGVNFAKMKDGWHCQVIDQITEEVKTDQVYWDLQSGKFIPLAGFEGPDQLGFEEYVTAAAGGFGASRFYSFSRCRYYGYNHWTEDMMNDFGNGDKTTYSDTLLEGLARAYSGYASKFLWYQYGGAGEASDTLKTKLAPLQLPSQQRIDTVNYYIGKAIETYKILASRNPRYMTSLGNSAMKVFNEQMNGYMQMMMAGRTDLAKNYISSIQSNATIKAIAANYLNNCPPNTVLFAFGDNDTYPLWYLQEAENFRKDVAVININLLSLPIYIDMLYRNRTVSFTTTAATYGDPSFLYFIKREGNKKTATLHEFITTIQNKTFPEQSEFYGNMATYPQAQILFNVDLLKFKKINTQPNLQPRVKINLSDYITNDQLMVLDIIQSNLYNRPICFSAVHDLLANYLQLNGLVYQFLPLDTTKGKLTEKITALKTKDYLIKTYKPTPGNNFYSGLVADGTTDASAYSMYRNVTAYYNSKGRTDSALYMVNHLLAAYKNDLPFTFNKNGVAAVMLDAGREKEAVQLFMDYIETLYRLHKNPSTAYPYFPRTTVLNTAIDIQLIFHLKNIDRTRIDQIVSLLNKEPH